MAAISEIEHLTINAVGRFENHCLDHSGSGLSPVSPG